MHDPMTVAFDIRSPIKRKSKFFPKGYREPLVTIWHCDPEKDGSDDSCGWFMRSRHGDPKTLERIVKRISFDWDRIHESDNGYIYHCGYFKPNGNPHFSPIGITVDLFHHAAGIVFDKTGDSCNWKAAERFMRRHLAAIILFAENPTDSLHDTITRKFEIGCGEEHTERRRQERIHAMASIIYGWILRANRPWYRHPRWHFWHWRFQVHPLQKLRRWLFERCVKCGKGYPWGYAPIGNGSGKKSWHHDCDTSKVP